MLLAFSGAPRAADATDLVVGPEFMGASLAGHMALLRDPKHRFDIQDVAFGAQRTGFQPASGPIALGYTEDAVWFRVRIHRDGAWPSNQFLRFQPNYLDSIRVFVPQTAAPSSAGDYRVTELGDHSHGPERMFFPPFQAMPLTPPDTEAFDIYIRVATSSSLVLRTHLSTEAQLSRAAAFSSFSLGAVVAFLFGLGLLHAYNWARTHQAVFFWFSGFLVWLSITLYSMGGFDVVGDNRIFGIAVSDHLAYLALFMIHFFGLGFMITQSEAKIRVPWLYLATRAVMGFILLSIVATLFGLYSWVIDPNLTVISILLVIFAFVNVRLALQEKVGRTVSAIACLVYASVIVPYDAVLMGWVTLQPFAMNSIVAGSVFFIGLMTVSLMQRAAAFDRLRKESEDLRIARRAERAATDLVEVRTAELLVAKEQAENALEQERAAQREQLRFVDVVTHQYKTPLAVIRSSATAIRYALTPEDEENRQRIRQIEAAVGRLVEIMDVSLSRTRMEGHLAKAARKSVPVIATVTNALNRNRDLLPGRTIRATFHRIEETDHADLAPEMLAIALPNLVDNAAQFSEPGTPVSVRVARAGANLTIEGEDEGIGIPPDEFDKVSERYYRASNAGNVMGTGLGLNIVRQIAAAHDGTLRIQPRNRKGVVARIVFPAF